MEAKSQGFFAQVAASFKRTSKDLIPFIKADWPLLLAVTIYVELMLQFFMRLQEQAAQSQTLMIAVVVGKIAASLTQYVFLTMLIPLRMEEKDRNAPRGSFWTYAMRHMSAFAIESIRALAHVILWTLALIIPGIYKYIRLFFVPYVVLCDEQYQKGERDALERSMELTKGVFFPFLLLFIVMGAIEVLGGYFREKLVEDPSIPYLIPGLILVIMAVFFVNILLFRLYQLRVKALE